MYFRLEEEPIHGKRSFNKALASPLILNYDNFKIFLNTRSNITSSMFLHSCPKQV